MKNTKSCYIGDLLQDCSNIEETENELLKICETNNASDYYTCRGVHDYPESNSNCNSPLTKFKPYERSQKDLHLFKLIEHDNSGNQAIRMIKAKFAKTKALLEQKIEFYQIEMAELKENHLKIVGILEGNNEKEMYESLFKTLKSTSNSKSYQSLELIKRVHEKQIDDIQAEYKKIRIKLETNLVELKETNNNLNFNLKDAVEELDKLKLKYEYKCQESEYIKSKFELKYNELETEKDNTIKSLKEDLEKEQIYSQKEINRVIKKSEDELEQQSDRFEKNITELRYFYERERNNFITKVDRLQAELEVLKDSYSHTVFSDYEMSNIDESNNSMINASRSGNNANNEILALKMKNEETEKSLKRLEKLLMKSKNEQQEIIKSKNKEIKTINQKLIEAEKRKLMEDKKASAALQKKICALKCNMSKIEANKRGLEDKLKEVEMELETERILQRKRKVKDRNEVCKANETASKMARNIETLQNRIRMLEKEKSDLETKRQSSKSKLDRMKTRNINFDTNSKRRGSGSKSALNRFSSINKLQGLNHSQSNDIILTQSRDRCISGFKTKDNRDLSVNSKKSNVPHLNLSDISNSSPVSTNRIFSNRSKKKPIINPSNTTATNVSFCGSINGVFKSSLIGSTGDGSSKYCAACKFKEWKKKQLNYDVEELIKNRDMLRTVQCLGCNIQYEVKYFIDHVKSCRLAYNIPSMISKDEVLAKLSYNFKYFTTKKSETSRCGSSHNDKQKDKCCRILENSAEKEKKEAEYLSYSTKIPEGLFRKLRMFGSNKNEEKVDKFKNSKIKNVQNFKYLRDVNTNLYRDSSNFLSRSAKYDEGIAKSSLNKISSSKNFRYSKQVHEEDSDEPDVPNENPTDYTKYENVTLDKELTSMSQYQTVPRRLEMLNSNDTTVFRSSENMKENHIIFSAEKCDNSLINSKSSYSVIPDIMRTQPLTQVMQNPESDFADFRINSISEYDF